MSRTWSRTSMSMVMMLVLVIAGIGCSAKSTTNAVETTQPSKVEKVYIYANAGNLEVASSFSKPEELELVRQEIIKKSGFEIVPIIPPKGGGDKLSLLLASNEPLDIFMGDVVMYRNHKAIQPVQKLLDKHGANILKLWPEAWSDSWKAFSDKEGNVWGIPSAPSLALKPVFLRTDWLKKLNLSMPTTIEEFEHVLQAFKEKDPMGNGQTIPLIAPVDALNLGLAGGFMDIGYGNWLDTDGKIKPAELHPGYRAFIEKMSEWYKKGYIYKETYTLSSAGARELVTKGRVGASLIHYSLITNSEHQLQQIVPEAKYEVAADLKGPQGFIQTLPDTPTLGWLISKNSKNPEAAIKLINWIYSDIENYNLLFYGIKDRHWKYVDEENHVMEQLNQDYAGEFLTASTVAYMKMTSFSDPAQKPEYDYLSTYSGDTSRVKKGTTADRSFLYDYKLISDSLPNQADITRMTYEEIVKFITGARPMSDYDKFIEELYAAGLDKWIEVYTEQYNNAK
ncbi:extracellular solute-binding protein [Paenibacillus eucommiae]|uniref:ABC-type glycerol-3-phosphate transport system substrate-binding protein n=1 Tax=Paenibacillus eucommiae TaxID=1355755 RepID=A0ABS4IWE7_9BACL|nr:extracellular solute-binding protein [Paenibacillus eucommiae]MBP1991405.1 ABC-type glycerol-3-phosphate transport system substrate-binding protein [Paenibacillus eucommiae]